MSGRMQAKKVVARPINLIFRYLQNKTRVQIMLYEQTDVRIEGVIIGFDEYMNLVMDDAEELSVKNKSRKKIGRILLKGDNITLMMKAGGED
eukprot:CAMPEP_0201516138 /NCGR_PEP_ID=MMETSP0161_2-20130828/7533_1 /ASSEMBLY_ACC=CAM_ASM_000251 /TAXON_ID=180227 /ORGANISM="Neoparamoeba aestuarina, Strain SoJaBio B1-5/56/2" /LENGTH=91 /DNA_ID=CAMNT_0047913161 /DNA_START=89 /DNA_END=364 /DNA_ORIENTATION=-